MGKPVCPEFNNENFECKCSKTVTVYRNPVIDEIIFEAAQNVRNLDVVLDASFSIDIIIYTVVFKIFDCFQSYFAIGKLGRLSYD